VAGGRAGFGERLQPKRDGLKIRSITYAKLRQSINFSGIGDDPISAVDMQRSWGGKRLIYLIVQRRYRT
jgi:hypothetical protein